MGIFGLFGNSKPKTEPVLEPNKQLEYPVGQGELADFFTVNGSLESSNLYNPNLSLAHDPNGINHNTPDPQMTKMLTSEAKEAETTESALREAALKVARQEVDKAA